MPNKDGKGPKGDGLRDGHGQGKGRGTGKGAGPKTGGQKGNCETIKKKTAQYYQNDPNNKKL